MDVAGYVCVCRCVCVSVSEREEEGRQQTYHPRSPPVNSGGQTISLIEFNPGSPQEARRLVAPLSMERAGGGGGGGGGEVCAYRRDGGGALAGMTSERGKGEGDK